MTYTEEQLQVIEQTLTSLRTAQRAILVGYAGTGKTTCLGEIIKRYEGTTFGITAPTNKAVKVLSEKLTPITNKLFADCLYSTLHSFLRLKPVIDNRTGEQKFLPDRNAPMHAEVDLLIVDEASMVSSELLELLLEYSEDHSCPVLLVGDSAQLPPVNEQSSPALDLSWPTARLSTVMRHAGPILEYAQRVRLLDGSLPRGAQKLPVYAEAGCLFRDPVDWARSALELFRSDAFTASSDHVRMLCWTNERVRELNKLIHEGIYGIGKTWMVGQRLVANKPIGDQSAFLMTNGEEATILSVTDDVSTDNLPIYRLRVRPDTSFPCTLTVLKREGIPAYLEQEGVYKTRALGEDGWRRSRAWREYYEFCGRYADVAPVYCQTIHKAQGSTYQNVYIDIRDVLKNTNRVEGVRCLYTGVTRAAVGLFTLI